MSIEELLVVQKDHGFYIAAREICRNVRSRRGVSIEVINLFLFLYERKKSFPVSPGTAFLIPDSKGNYIASTFARLYLEQ